jgi:hypothetical protein
LAQPKRKPPKPESKADRERQTVLLYPDMRKALHHAAVEEGREISDIAADALGRYLRKK